VKGEVSLSRGYPSLPFGALIGAANVLLAGCATHHQSVVDAAGPQAGRIEGLFWFFTYLLAAIFLIVIVMLLGTLLRGHRGIEQEPLEGVHAPSTATERKLHRNVLAATIVTVLILIGLLVSSVSTGKALSSMGARKDGMAVEVIGNQWWWYARYRSDIADRTLTTANEIHIPVGRPVMIRGTSNDVIHSFWVPNLNGKIDFIPSRVNTQWIVADRPGRFRGQCAEFCGIQHAHMALWVIAESPDQFEAWMNAQLKPATTPADPDLLHGQQVFLNHACVFCHTIAGPTAQGSVGPDLTHVGSRSTIAAGTLPNTKGNLGGWIVDPQNIKPGNHMATVDLSPDDLQSLLDYLESLK
jgi:cytochrome c oxidase subunit II